MTAYQVEYPTEVTMDYAFGMNVLKSLSHLPHLSTVSVHFENVAKPSRANEITITIHLQPDTS